MHSYRTRLMPILALAGAALALSACENVQKELGLGKNPPDEFRVVKRAPLSMPPQFQLRPPAPGVARPQEGTPRQQAETAVFTREGEESALAAQRFDDVAGLSDGERSLLARAGADEAPDDIRQVVNRESQKLREANESLLGDLLFWKEDPPPGEVVDAGEEAGRIREQQALGKESEKQDGADIQIERKESGGLFDGWF